MYFRQMEVRSNKISDIRQYYKAKLLENYDEREAEALLLLLIEAYTGISKLKIISEPGLTLSESELLKVHFAVKDLNNHKPVQYILGKTEFYGLTIKVDKDVLIPRPETEELVEMVIKENQQGKKLRILDIGTGSGCIAIALKKFLPECEVVAIDISNPALNLAQINANSNKQSIEFKSFDILAENNWYRLGFYDIIVSNPPYVRHSERSIMKRNVIDYEPGIALFVDDQNPLVFYKAVAEFGAINLNKNGRIYCEINQYLGEDVLKLFSKQGYNEIELVQDINGHNRFIKASSGN